MHSKRGLGPEKYNGSPFNNTGTVLCGLDENNAGATCRTKLFQSSESGTARNYSETKSSATDLEKADNTGMLMHELILGSSDHPTFT